MYNNLDGLFICDLCTTHYKYPLNSDDTFAYENTFHRINLGIAGYGSRLDGSDIYFNLCDVCLADLVDKLRPERRELILNDKPYLLDE